MPLDLNQLVPDDTNTLDGPPRRKRITPPRHEPPAAALPYTVTFYERDTPERQLRALLGDTPPTPTQSAGDWEVVALPKRSAVTIWRGRQDLLRMTVPIVLGAANAPPVLTEHTALLKAWRPDDDTEQPPVLKVVANGDAVPYQHLAWVVDGSPEWGDAIGGTEARRVMQKLTVTLLEYRADEKLQLEQARSPKRRKTRTHIVKRGETLQTIARKFKISGGWRTLGDAQHPPIRDPRNVHVGQKLVIPA